MKKTHLLVITILILGCLVFTACNQNQNKDMESKGDLQNNEKELSEDESGTSEILSVQVDKGNNSNDVMTHSGSLDETTFEDDEYLALSNNEMGLDNKSVEDVNGSESAVYYYIDSDVVRMREDGSLDADTLELLNRGSRVEYIDRKGDWLKVRYDNIVGYVRNDLLSETQDLDENVKEFTKEETAEVIGNESTFESPIYYYVNSEVVRMREDGSLDADTLDLLKRGSRVEYIDRKGEWFKVKYDNVVGYIRNDLISETQPTKSSPEDILGQIENPTIIIKKADRSLQLCDGDVLLASYPIGLGWEPVGDKQKEGDGRTPEGKYYICTRNGASRFYLSLGLSYPNIVDAREALDANLISQSEFEQIDDAIRQGVKPPWNTHMGGEIMIHGHGSQSDWTAGCIAVNDEIMDILWNSCKIGTPVIIEP